MRRALVLCMCVTVALASSYTDRFDSTNLDDLLQNRRLLVAYIKCVLDEAKCSSEGKELKQHFTEAFQEECVKCTEKEKEGVKSVISYIYKNEQEFWKKIKAKYDPENKHDKILKA